MMSKVNQQDVGPVGRKLPEWPATHVPCLLIDDKNTLLSDHSPQNPTWSGLFIEIS